MWTISCGSCHGLTSVLDSDVCVSATVLDPEDSPGREIIVPVPILLELAVWLPESVFGDPGHCGTA